MQFGAAGDIELHSLSLHMCTYTHISFSRCVGGWLVSRSVGNTGSLVVLSSIEEICNNCHLCLSLVSGPIPSYILPHKGRRRRPNIIRAGRPGT